MTFVSDIWGSEYMHLFWSDNFSGNLISCDEGELEWVDKSKVNSLKAWEGDKIFLRLIEKNVPFFSLKLIYEGEILKKAVLNGSDIKLPFGGDI